MKISKKVIGLAGTLMLSAVVLAGCSTGSQNLATSKAGNITQQDYLNKVKQDTNGKQLFQTLAVEKVLDHQYGKKVSDKAVDSQVNVYKQNYGSSFNQTLKTNNLTMSTFKKQLKNNLELKEAVKANTDFSDKALKKEWKSYEPATPILEMAFSSKAKAEKVSDKLNKKGTEANFKKLAKKYSVDSSTASNGGAYTLFDPSSSATLDNLFVEKAMKLDTGEFTKKPVKTSNGYQLIYMVKRTPKGTFSERKDALKDKILTTKMNDSDAMRKAMVVALKKDSMHIEDKDLKSSLDSLYKPATESTPGVSGTSAQGASGTTVSSQAQ